MLSSWRSPVKDYRKPATYYERQFTDILKPLYKKCNGTIFESAEMRDYLEILNICIANKTLKIKENKIEYACTVIYAIYTHSSEDRSYLEGWEPKIVEKLKIDPNTYKQRKSDIKNGQASESLLSFYNRLYKILTIAKSWIYDT